MTYYEKKRKGTKLSQLDVANFLGMSYERYKLIERGDVKMPTRLINKFNELLHKDEKINDLEKMDKLSKIDKWWDEMRKPLSNNKKGRSNYQLWNKCQEFNIKNYGELARLLGYKDSSIISHALKGDTHSGLIYERIYDFFQDELNIQIVKDKSTNNVSGYIYNKPTEVERKTYDNKYTKYRGYIGYIGKSKEELNNIIDWYESNDFKVWCENNNETIYTIANNINIHPQTAKLLLENKIVWLQILIKFYNYVNKNKQDVVVLENTDKEIKRNDNTLKNKILTTYTNKLENINNNLIELEKTIKELTNNQVQLEKEKVIYEQIIKDINEYIEEN